MKGIVLTRSAMKSNDASGACTVILDYEHSKIVRIVSNEKGGPITNPYNSRYSCLDIIEFEPIKACPIGPQQENTLVQLDSIKKIDRYSGSFESIYNNWSRILKNEPKYMSQRSYKLDSVDEYNHSIEIVKVHDLVIGKNERGKIKANFYARTFRNRDELYQFFSVTDPDYLPDWNPEAEFGNIGNAFLVISIPHSNHEQDGEYKGFYKFIAAVYPD